MAKKKRQKFGWADGLLMGAMIAFGGYCFYRIARDSAEYEAPRAPRAEHVQPSAYDPVPRNDIVLEAVEKPSEPVYRTVKVKVTAYCPCTGCCGPGATGKTSTGDNAYVFDGVAVDPRAIPYRSKIEIPGIGTKEADDTGGAMRQYWEKEKKVQIDVRMPTHEEAKQWGVRELEVKVYIAKRK